MALANPLWGAPRIHGELLKLGLDVSQRSVARLMRVARNHHRRRGARSSGTISPTSLGRLLRRADRDLSRSLRVRDPVASSPPGRAL
jgi:hypothetical protein